MENWHAKKLQVRSKKLHAEIKLKIAYNVFPAEKTGY